MTPPPAAAAAARTLQPRRARRVSGPAAGRAPGVGTARAAVAAPAQGGFALGALDRLERLSNHTLLDRLIRGRAWIGVIAFALIGIVTMQLWLLKLNTGIGHAVEHAAMLERVNSAISRERSERASGESVDASAPGVGMVAVAPGALTFLTRSGNDARRAADVLRSSAPSTTASESLAGSGESLSSATSETVGSTGVPAEAATTPAGESTNAEPGAPSESAAPLSETAPSTSTSSTPTSATPPEAPSYATGETSGGASSPVAESPTTGAAGVSGPGGGTQPSAGG